MWCIWVIITIEAKYGDVLNKFLNLAKEIKICKKQWLLWMAIMYSKNTH